MKTRDMMYISLFAAIIAVLGLVPAIPVPVSPVPITLQTLGVGLAGAVLGARRGFLAVLLFVLLVAAGAPILAGGRGGLAVLLGPSGGYVMSYPIGALVIGLLVEKYWEKLKFWNLFLFQVIGGIFVIHFFGVIYLWLITGKQLLPAAVSTLVFFPGDTLKLIIASYIALRINKSNPLIKKNKKKEQSDILHRRII